MKTEFAFIKILIICIAMNLMFSSNLIGQNAESVKGYGIASYIGFSEGQFLRNWLILGPVKMNKTNSNPDLKAQEEFFNTDAFTNVMVQKDKPMPKMKINGFDYSWKAVKNETATIDFNQQFGLTEYACVYALTEINMEAPANVIIGVGSDDAIKIFLNGELVHRNWIARAANFDQDHVMLNLKKGSNQLLVKVQNERLDWTLIIRRLGHSTANNNNWGAYMRALPNNNFDGKKFKFQVSARAEVVQDSAMAGMFFRVDKKVGSGFFENTQNRPFRSKDWGTIKIEGIIDSTVAQLVFGFIYQGNGTFWYDNLNLSIETKPGIWETIFQDGFENALENWYSNNPEYTINNIEIKPIEGKKCLQILGKNIPEYGMNNHAGKYTNVNGIKLYSEIYGKGKPLVLLHENGGSIQSFAQFIPELALNYKVIAIDSRAHGNSGETNSELTYDLMASDINEQLNQLNIDSAYILGQGGGAIIALTLAKDHPEKVKKIVSFAANISADSSGIEPVIYLWIEKYKKNSKYPKEIKLLNLIYKYPNFPIADLQKIKAEVLVLSGDRDFVPLEHTIRIFKNIPKSNLFIFPGATSNAILEQSDLFYEVVTKFFEMPFSMPATVDWYK